MKIIVDYTEHPDFDGPQSVLDADTLQPIDIKDVVGKKIISATLISNKIQLELEDYDQTLIAQLEDFSSRLLNAENDNEHYSLILRGDWRNSVEILEAALQKAKTKRSSNDNKTRNTGFEKPN